MSLLQKFATIPTVTRDTVSAPAIVASTSGVSKPEPWLTEIGWTGSGGRSRVRTLPPVSPHTAERHATVYASCNNIAGDLAKVPLKVWERQPGGGEKQVRDHAISYLLNVEASPGVPAVLVRMGLVYAFALRGVAYGWAPRDGAGEVTMIDAIGQDGVAVHRDGRRRVYDFEDGDGVRRRAPGRAMIHMRYGASDGWTHKSPLRAAFESFGLALAGQEAAARTASGGTVRGYVRLRDDYENDEARLLSAQRIKRALSDPSDSSLPVLGEDEEIKSLDLSAADQQLLESRKFDREQIASVYRMPMSKLQILENGVKANGQQQAIDYLTDCLMHWSRLVEPALGLTLLTRGERERGLFLRHDFKALLQPTTKEQFEALKIGVGGPFMTPNEARREAKLGEIEDGGDLYPPSNMTRGADATGAKEGDGDDE